MKNLINHLNYATETGHVYCRRLEGVVRLDQEHFADNCSTCPMFSGSLQGDGVECEWVDNRPDVTNPHPVTDPGEEVVSLIMHKIEKPKGNIRVKKEN
ncbi:hypothetical protein [Bacillus paranthracis]|uniref:hypothetical protein n=1 Tax=Bacillus paranthracis TaxID=2026186 RepID=UPI0022E14554|nr:hypothetical protein [Bacillus paranthracis]